MTEVADKIEEPVKGFSPGGGQCLLEEAIDRRGAIPELEQTGQPLWVLLIFGEEGKLIRHLIRIEQVTHYRSPTLPSRDGEGSHNHQVFHGPAADEAGIELYQGRRPELTGGIAFYQVSLNVLDAKPRMVRSMRRFAGDR